MGQRKKELSKSDSPSVNEAIQRILEECKTKHKVKHLEYDDIKILVRV